MQIGKMYHDNMDPTRGIKPAVVKGSKVDCQVYFEDESTGGMIYVGRAELPLKSFSDGPAKTPSERVGFSLRIG